MVDELLMTQLVKDKQNLLSRILDIGLASYEDHLTEVPVVQQIIGESQRTNVFVESLGLL
jgi:hypothetical protein